jgi:hypothetical protein
MANELNHHPDTEGLLDYLDGSSDREQASHIEHCVQCLRDLEQIRQTREQLTKLPQLQPPAHLWGGIQTALEPRKQESKLFQWFDYRWAAAAASILIILGILLVPMHSHRSQLNDEYASLLQESRRLESTLSFLDRQPVVLKLGTAARVAQYRDGIAAIDLALNEYSEGKDDPTLRNSLIRERIFMMRNLVEEKAEPLLASSYQAF